MTHDPTDAGLFAELLFAAVLASGGELYLDGDELERAKRGVWLRVEECDGGSVTLLVEER